MSALPTVPPSVVALPTGGDSPMLRSCVTAAPAITTAATTYPASAEAAAVVGFSLVGKNSCDQMHCIV
jgi:hypothetical protein